MLDKKSLLQKVNFLIETNRIQEAFKLEKEILQNNLSKQYPDIMDRLQAFNIPLQDNYTISHILSSDILRILKTDIDINQRFKIRIMPYPEESQEIIKLDLFDIYITNKELLGNVNLKTWFEKYSQSIKPFKKTTVLYKKQFIEKDENAKIIFGENKLLLFKALSLFDFFYPNYLEDAEQNKMDSEKSELKEKSFIIHNEKQNYFPINASPSVSTKKIGSRINIIKFSLSEAIQKYPKIYDQIITSEFIKLKSSPDLTRPSVRNWLYDYRQKMGGEKGDALRRGNYIYQSENGKKLSAEEREKLSYLLKYYDENALLEIDPEEQKIIFPEFKLQKPVPKPTNVSREFNYTSQPEKSKRDDEPFTLEEKFSQSGIFNKKHIVRKSTGFSFGNFKSENYSKSKTNPNKNNRAHNQLNSLAKNIHFSFPQKFNWEESEKKIEHYNPRIIRPIGLKREKELKAQENLVDLREN